jgi:hypothetical protein
MSFNIYKLIHFFGIFLLFLSLGGMFMHAMNGGTKDSNESRKFGAIMHGLGLFLILLGGFGMLARGVEAGIYESHHPTWIIVKLVLWVVFGAALMIPNRFPKLAKPMWVILPILGVLAGYVGLYKPF